MTLPVGTISQLNIRGTITQKGVGGTITQKGVTSTISESAYVHIIPTFVSGVVEDADSDLVILTFSEALDEASIPATTAFVFSGITGNPTVTNVVISGTDVSLTLSAAVTYGDVVTLAYTKPGTNPLQDSDKDDVASFSDESVTNNVEQTYCDEYLAVYNEFTNKPSAADAIIQNAKMLAIVAGGRYAKSERHWEFSVHTNAAGEAQLDWIDPVNHLPVTNVNGATWIQYQGFLGNIIPPYKYLRSNFNPIADATLISQNNICISYGVGNDVYDTRYDLGATQTEVGSIAMGSRQNPGRFWTFCNCLTASVVPVETNSIGYHTMSRGNAAGYEKYKNTSQTVVVEASTGVPNLEIYILSRNENDVAQVPCSHQLRYVDIGEYLIEAEVGSAITDEEAYLDNYGTGLIP